MDSEEQTTEETTKADFARSLVKFAAGQSVTFVVAGVIKNYVPTNNRLQQVELIIGSYVLANMMRDQAIDWADVKLDDAIEGYKKALKKLEEYKEDSPDE